MDGLRWSGIGVLSGAGVAACHRALQPTGDLWIARAALVVRAPRLRTALWLLLAFEAAVAINAGWVGRRAWYGVLAGGMVLHGPVLMGTLLLLGQLATSS